MDKNPPARSAKLKSLSSIIAAITLIISVSTVMIACGSKGEPQPEESQTNAVEVPVTPEPEVAPEAQPEVAAETPPQEQAPTEEPSVAAAEPEALEQPVAEAQPEEEPKAEAVAESEPEISQPMSHRRAPVKSLEPTKPTPEQIVAMIMEDIKWGAIELKAPPTMKIDEKAAVRLTIDTTDVYERINKIIENEATKKGLFMNLAAQLDAHLTGNAFQVGNVVPETQSLVAPGNMEWQWDIKANKAGKQSINVGIKFSVSAGHDLTREQVVKTLDRSIEVTEATPKTEQAPMNNKMWIWIGALLAVIIVGVLIAIKMRSSEK